MKKSKLLAGMGVLACAGAALAFGLAAPVGADPGAGTGSTTDLTTTTGPGKHGHKGEKDSKDRPDRPGKACRNVGLRGSDGSGSVTLTVTKASGPNNSGLVGKPVTLTVAAGSDVHAVACMDAAGTLTLKQVVVRGPRTAAQTQSGDS